MHHKSLFSFSEVKLIVLVIVLLLLNNKKNNNDGWLYKIFKLLIS
jgi:hypothetical protein